ncbi:hypothetical protein HPGCJGGD_3000 [Methylobacterium haplocladii]|nr:hypothetical protein HPGCJGGD_3000 [Methylobacterium haplocladii]
MTAAETVVVMTAVMVVMPAMVARTAIAEVAMMVVVAAEVMAVAAPMHGGGAGFTGHGLDGGRSERSSLRRAGRGGEDSADGESGRSEQGTASMHGHSELLGLRTPV